VLELVAARLRDEEIAGRLGIAPSTVSTLLRSSMEKLDARTRVQAVAKLAAAAESAGRGPQRGDDGVARAAPRRWNGR
jgi:hypothetical protein